MDFTLTPEPVFSVSDALSSSSEQPLDLDFTLPDYCSDVEKIFKCTVTPEIFSVNTVGGQITIEGASYVRVLYCSTDKKRLRCAEQNVPFSIVKNLSTDSDDFIVNVTATQDYVNCKAVSKRRLMIHGAFTVHIKVLEKKCDNLYLPPDTPELQTSMSKRKISELMSLHSEIVSISESIPTDGKSQISTVLRTDIKSNLVDVTAIGNRLLVKGEVTFSMLYASDDKSDVPSQFTYVFPFVHNMECTNADSATTRETDLSLMSYDYKLKSDIIGDSPVVLLEAKYALTVACRKETEVTYISDAYSTTSETEPEYSPVTLDAEVLPKFSSLMCKSSVSLGDTPISRIIDIFCDSVSVKADVGSTLDLTGKANFCILCTDSNDELQYIERSVEISGKEPLSGEYSLCTSVTSMIKSLSFRLGEDNNLELRAEVYVMTKLKKLENIRFVSSLRNMGEIEDADNCALTLYYADSQESVWEIAKKYKTNKDMLVNENNLTEDVLEDKMLLLIPKA